MTKPAPSSRHTIKKTLTALFLENDPLKICAFCASLSAENGFHPLFSLLYSQDPRIKWAAISCMGENISLLAQIDMEKARILMRYFIWNLNDESGGIGWGLPEAMGETLYQSAPLAQEYHRILISYLDPNGNYLELPLLRQGAVWGVGRAAQRHHHLFAPAVDFLQLDLNSPITSLRGHALWALGNLNFPDKTSLFSSFLTDENTFDLYTDHHLTALSIATLARQILSV